MGDYMQEIKGSMEEIKINRTPHQVSFDEGYDVGYEEGYEEGYNKGYVQAQRDMERKTDEEMKRHREQIRRLIDGE